MTSQDQTIHDALVYAITLMAVCYGLYLLLRVLKRRRPGFSIGVAVAVAVLLRVLASLAISLTSLDNTLRGGDEIAFLIQANNVADAPLGAAAWADTLTGALHTFTFGFQIFLLDSPDQALRIAQIGIAVAALILLSAAVYELAGARAAASS